MPKIVLAVLAFLIVIVVVLLASMSPQPSPAPPAPTPSPTKIVVPTEATDPEPTAEVEVVEEEGGMGLEEGIIVLTTLALVAAIALIESHLVGVYESGVLF